MDTFACCRAKVDLISVSVKLITSRLTRQAEHHQHVLSSSDKRFMGKSWWEKFLGSVCPRYRRGMNFSKFSNQGLGRANWFPEEWKGKTEVRRRKSKRRFQSSFNPHQSNLQRPAKKGVKSSSGARWDKCSQKKHNKWRSMNEFAPFTFGSSTCKWISTNQNAWKVFLLN